MPDDELLDICKDLAVEKARFTMDQNQAGIIRSKSEKEAKQFEGVLAETMSQILLLSELDDCSVVRFDLERNDFTYDPNEYDVVLDDGANQYEFEIRNSYSYKTTIEEAYANLDVLGAYTNGYKPQETLSDLFIRPLLQLNPPQEWRKYPPKYSSVEELINKIKAGDVILYLCCGTDKQTLLEKGYQSNFGQGNTKYLAIKMRETLDIVEFLESLK